MRINAENAENFLALIRIRPRFEKLFPVSQVILFFDSLQHLFEFSLLQKKLPE
jgi:hypothetical protein